MLNNYVFANSKNACLSSVNSDTYMLTVSLYPQITVIRKKEVLSKYMYVFVHN